jgi:hypothetical protein
MSGFDTFHVHAVEPAGMVYVDGPRDLRTSRFTGDEAAARSYLDQILTASTNDFREIVAPEEPARVPGLTILDTQRSPFEANRVVRFRQSHQGVPVFGSRVVVELGAEQEFVSADLKTGGWRSTR